MINQNMWNDTFQTQDVGNNGNSVEGFPGSRSVLSPIAGVLKNPDMSPLNIQHDQLFFYPL